MKDLLYFENMLTPKIVTIIYWLSLIGIVIAALATLFTGSRGFLVNIVLCVLILVLGSLMARIYCELVIVIFKIYESVHKLANK